MPILNTLGLLTFSKIHVSFIYSQCPLANKKNDPSNHPSV